MTTSTNNHHFTTLDLTYKSLYNSNKIHCLLDVAILSLHHLLKLVT
jgi:hypothetical protein